MSRGLGQGELLEPAPPRKLLVPEEHVFHWGVDPSTLRVALAVASELPLRHLRVGRAVCQVPFRQTQGGERLATIWWETRRLAATWARSWPPGVVAFEQPSGKQQNLELSYACGVIMGAVFAGVLDATHHRVRTATVTSSEWKAVACGKGNIYKPKLTAREEYGVLTWARAQGYEGRSWDEADAMGVAEWARRTFALEERGVRVKPELEVTR
jgi:hypothetical protein